MPSSTLIKVTPCVARPISRISDTRVRTNIPPVVINIIWSSGDTKAAATTLPLRSDVWIAIMPFVPRPWRVYSPMGVRLPKPFSVAVNTLVGIGLPSESTVLACAPSVASAGATNIAITCWPATKFIPRTPRAVRPIGRTSFSSKRTALPASENSITSCWPSVIAAPTKKSFSFKSTAMMPALRGLEKSDKRVFFTVPKLVAMNT